MALRDPWAGADRRRRGAAMLEALLVLPFIMVLLAIVIYFGFAFERLQRTVIADRYEATRGAARAPGPSTGIDASASTRELRRTFYAGDDVTLTFEPSDFFPIEPTEALQTAAADLEPDAGRLYNQYFSLFPRGRSIRLFADGDSSVPLWDRLFTLPVRHRHTVMDTDWRFFNHVTRDNLWYDDETKTEQLILEPRTAEGTPENLPTLGPGQAVRETFYSDFDRRLAPLASGNPVAERLQSFYTLYPTYRGPEVHTVWTPAGGWQR
ncbi:MAG: TadE family protein [Planctomycetota bacterium]